MKVMTTTTLKTSLPKTSKVKNIWGVYDNESGQLVFIGMSRSSAREYRSYFEDASHLSGPRKINVTASMA